MRTVFKYEVPFDSNVTLKLPVGAELLHFGNQREIPTLWALVDSKASPVARQFRSVEVVNDLAEERLRVHLAAKRLVDAVYDARHEDCEECSNERIAVSWDLCRVTPCPSCRRADYATFMAKLAREAEECPTTLRNTDVGRDAHRALLPDETPALSSPQKPALLPHIRRGLEALREGDLACQQPRATIMALEDLHFAGLVETRGAAYYLTAAGKDALR